MHTCLHVKPSRKPNSKILPFAAMAAARRATYLPTYLPISADPDEISSVKGRKEREMAKGDCVYIVPYPAWRTPAVPYPTRYWAIIGRSVGWISERPIGLDGDRPNIGKD